MAIGHIKFDRATAFGALLSRGLDDLENAIDRLNDVFDVMTQMKDGDGSQATHFDYAVSKFGFATNVDAKATYDELNSVLSKLNVNTSVTNVNAAVKQILAKLRN